MGLWLEINLGAVRSVGEMSKKAANNLKGKEGLKDASLKSPLGRTEAEVWSSIIAITLIIYEHQHHLYLLNLASICQLPIREDAPSISDLQGASCRCHASTYSS
jgi:hypothetical protein